MESQKKILVIDDAQDLANVMSDTLEFKGYAPLVAYNGKDGLALALKEHPDLILIDVRMPDMTGYDVIRELRKDEWGKDAKILILTATDFLGDRPTDLGLRPHDYLSKAMWGINNVIDRVEKKLAE